MDDDTFVHVQALVSYLKTAKYGQSLYMGYFSGKEIVVKNKTSKWYEEDYDLCDRYIPYAKGGGREFNSNLYKCIYCHSYMVYQLLSMVQS